MPEWGRLLGKVVGGVLSGEQKKHVVSVTQARGNVEGDENKFGFREFICVCLCLVSSA
jgi:hypothetical protein